MAASEEAMATAIATMLYSDHNDQVQY